MDSIIAPVVLSATALVSNLMSSAKNARELAKLSSDSDLKVAIGEMLSDIIEVKLRVSDLDDENRALKAQLLLKASLTRTSEFGYWFKDGDVGDPLCPKCYEGRGMLIYLPAAERLDRGILRVCRECKHMFWEREFASDNRSNEQGISWMGR